MKRSGLDKTKQFSAPWWFRTGLTANLLSSQDVKRIVKGVVCKPDAWVAGQQVASWVCTAEPTSTPCAARIHRTASMLPRMYAPAHATA